MKKLFVCLAIALGVLVSNSNAHAEELVYAQVDAYYNYDEAYKLMGLINDYRAANGLSRLKTNDKLMKIAMKRALECNVYFAHNSPTGKGTAQAVYDLGYLKEDASFNEFKVYGFNEIIYGAASDVGVLSSDALNGWKNSSAHNDAILNRNDHAGEKQFAIGVGFVNGCAVTCFFSSTEALGTGNNTKLINYSKTETVLVLKTLVDNGNTQKDKCVTYGNEKKENKITNKKDSVNTKQDKKNNTSKNNKTTRKSTSEKIKEAKVSGVSLSKKRVNGGVKVTVKFNKVTTVKDLKYQIQVSNNSKFKKQSVVKKNGRKVTTNKGTWRISGNSNSNSKAVTVKKSGNTVWVRVRCYKKVKGKTVYGKWSKVKSKKIR